MNGGKQAMAVVQLALLAFIVIGCAAGAYAVIPWFQALNSTVQISHNMNSENYQNQTERIGVAGHATAEINISEGQKAEGFANATAVVANSMQGPLNAYHQGQSEGQGQLLLYIVMGIAGLVVGGSVLRGLGRGS